jgi:hypothetical protein
MNSYYLNITHFIKLKALVGFFSIFILVSCTENADSPGVEFMPDMYRATGYEAYLKIRYRFC